MPAPRLLPLPASAFPALGITAWFACGFMCAPKYGEPMRLLPIGRCSSAVKPCVGSGSGAAKRGHDLCRGELGKKGSKGHGQNLAAKEKSAMQKIVVAKCLQCRHNATMNPMKFRTKKAAIEAVEECQRHGWKAGVYGSGPWFVNAIHTNSNGVRITYDLHKDGVMREYSRKGVAV